MTPSIRGALLASDFVARVVPVAFADPDADGRAAAYRALRRWRLREGAALGPVSSVRTLLDRAAIPVFALLGYQLRQPAAAPRLAGQTAILCAGDSGAVGLVVTPWDAAPAGAWSAAVRHALDHRLDWCFVFNGQTIRVNDARRTYARHFVEIDLESAVDDESVFTTLWLLLHARRFSARDHEDDQGTFERIVAASDRHASSVCGALQHGVHAALEALLDAFQRATHGRGTRRPPLEALFDHALTVVYRVLFLLFAEARQLVPSWHPVYRQAYTIEALQEHIRQAGLPGGVWEGLQAIARLAHDGCRAGDLRVTPFNGRLFTPQAAPLADALRLDEGRVREALTSLTVADGRHRIAYADLGVEQLGAVYERVLDYQPVGTRPDPTVRPSISERRTLRLGGTGGPDAGRAGARRARLQIGGTRRKSTGTFYTPRQLTDFLVRRTLHPLVHDAPSGRILSLRIVDPAMGSGAFLVAACRYLSSAYESALVAEGTAAPEDIDEPARTGFRRLVAQQCLFGVDLNPVAVQLGRLSLWLATLAADRPLTFLDHRLRAGDSLIGASIEDVLRQPPVAAARRARPGELPLLELLDLQSAVRSVLPDRQALAVRGDDTIEAVRDKEARLAQIERALARWKRQADLWCAGWFWDSAAPMSRQTYLALCDEIRHGSSPLPRTTAAALLAQVQAVSAERRFFHWTLEFPEVFVDGEGRPRPDGGFDAVLGNPPWDMMRADAGAGEEGQASRAQEARFVRSSGLYRTHIGGHANRYQLFVERALSLLRPGGRLGLVAPMGLAIDHGSAALRRHLLSRADLDTLIGFENRRAIFPIHRGVRFLLATATAGRATAAVRCRFLERDAGVLDTLGDAAEDDPPAALPVTLTPAFLRRVSGEEYTIPELRSAIDVALFDKLTACAPAFDDPSGWAADLGRELNASDDRAHFQARTPGDRLLPVLDGKHVTPFRVDLDAPTRGIDRLTAARLLDRARTFGRPRLAYRDVASSSNRLTLIAAVVPAGAVTTHTLFCLRSDLDARAQAYLCGVLNSFVANYLVRPRVSTHVTVAMVQRLPVPRPSPRTRAGACADAVAALADALARPACPDRGLVAARLQALVARLYGLTREDLRHVLTTFPLVEEEEKERVLEAFEAVETEVGSAFSGGP